LTSANRIDSSSKKTSLKVASSTRSNLQNPPSSVKNHSHFQTGIVSKSQIQIKRSATAKKVIDSKGRPSTPQFSHFRSHHSG
jgi:hypothetical protein